MTKRFRPAVNVRWAKLLNGQPPFIHRKKSKGKFAVGVRYERKAHEQLALEALGVPGLTYIESPWIEFQDDNGRRWCQPDALLLSKPANGVLIYEIKYRHCLEAWWQLTHLYEPVVRVLFPAYSITGRMEICHWFDPDVKFPQGFDLTQSPLLIPKRYRVAVCIYNPGRNKRRLPGAGQSNSEGNSETPGQDRGKGSLEQSVGAASTRPRVLVQQGSCAVPAGAEGSTPIAAPTEGD